MNLSLHILKQAHNCLIKDLEFITLTPEQNERHEADDILNVFSWIQMSYFDSNFTEICSLGFYVS